MSKNIYVGNISFRAAEEDLMELFARFGQVNSAKIITDRESGRSKGFGFVEMASEEEADQAIAGLNGSKFLERELTVNVAKPQKPRDSAGGRGGFRGSGGGRGQGRNSGRSGNRY